MNQSNMQGQQGNDYDVSKLSIQLEGGDKEQKSNAEPKGTLNVDDGMEEVPQPSSSFNQQQLSAIIQNPMPDPPATVSHAKSAQVKSSIDSHGKGGTQKAPPSRGGARVKGGHANQQSSHYGQIAQAKASNGSNGVINQSRQDKFLQQHHLKQMQNWPFAQNTKDARRGGTAPEGQSRVSGNKMHSQMAQNAVSNNPYGMEAPQKGSDKIGSVSGQSQVLKISQIDSEQVSNSNASNGQMSGSGRIGDTNGSSKGTQNYSQQNHVIAKIYGKSNKLVFSVDKSGTSSSIGNSMHHHISDQYKKPKIQHMKDIMKQNNQATGNFKKVKIDNSKIKNIQIQQRQNQSSQLTETSKNGEPLKSTKNNRANANKSQNFDEKQTDSYGLEQKRENQSQLGVKQMTGSIKKIQSQVSGSYDVAQTSEVSKYQKEYGNSAQVKKEVEQQYEMNSSSSKMPGRRPKFIENNAVIVVGQQQRGENNPSRVSQRQSNLNRGVSNQSDVHGENTQSRYKQNTNMEEAKKDTQPQAVQRQLQGSQGQGQGQGQGQQQNQNKFSNHQQQEPITIKSNQPVKAVHQENVINLDELPQPNSDFPEEYQNIPQQFSSPLPEHDGAQQNQSPQQEDVLEQSHHELYADQNNVKFSSPSVHENEESKPSPQRSEERQDPKNDNESNGQHDQNNYHELDQMFNNQPHANENNLTEEQMQQQINFSIAQQQYSEMKRLQTSQGPRLVKYKTQQNVHGQPQHPQQSQSQNQVAVPPNTNIPLERPQERSQHSRPNKTGQNQNNQQPKFIQAASPQVPTSQEVQRQQERPPATAPSSQMQRIQQNQKRQNVSVSYNVQNQNENNAAGGQNDLIYKIAKIKGKLSSQFSIEEGNNGLAVASTIQANQRNPGEEREGESNQEGENHQQIQFSRTIDTNPTQGQQPQDAEQEGTQDLKKKDSQNINIGTDQQTPNTSGKMFVLSNNTQPLPKNLMDKNQNESGNEIKDEKQGPGVVAPGPVIGVPGHPVKGGIGYQYEQWQRPPSRQKEPNQALGLDDARPKTRGGGNGIRQRHIPSENHLAQYYGGHHQAPAHTHMSGREKKRNIQKFIPTSEAGVLSVSNMYQVVQTDMPGAAPTGGRNGPPGSNNRPRVIDFFHQRNNNINGFNSTGDQAQYFQSQYQQQKAQQFFQSTFDEQRSNFDIDQNKSGISSNNTSGVFQHHNSRRGGPQQQAGPHNASQQQRPPSRHKDPPQNLGLDLYPPGMGFATPGEFGPPVHHNGHGGATPHTQHHHGSLGPTGSGGIIGLDDDSDLDGLAIDSDQQVPYRFHENLEIDQDQEGYFWAQQRDGGEVRGGPSHYSGHPNLGQKQFKEDEDDFFNNQYRNMEEDAMAAEPMDVRMDKPEKRRHHTQKGMRFQRQPSESAATSQMMSKSGYHPRGPGGYVGGHAQHQSVGGNFHPSSNMLNQPLSQAQQQFSQTYGVGQGMMGPMVPGTAPSPGQTQHFQQQYHPALQQTQNFYIGMNQIIPQGNQQDTSSLASEFFNMSGNMQNLVHNATKSGQQPKRMIATAGTPGQNTVGFHSQGQNNGSGPGPKMTHQHNHSSHLQNLSGHVQQDFLQRGFANQRSPVNDRSSAIQHLVMQNPHLKHMNKPKSATGHRISANKKDRFKNLNNSGRFVGQNSTINVQHLKMYQKPKAGGWMDQSGNNNNSNSAAKTGMSAGPQSQKSQLQKQMIKPNTAAETGGAKTRNRNQVFLNGGESSYNGENSTNNNNSSQMGANATPAITDNMQERIKIGQEINNNRPKESKGQRSTEKRHINNQSLGITSNGAPPSGVGLGEIPLHVTHIKRNKNGNFVSSPIAGHLVSSSNHQNFSPEHLPKGGPTLNFDPNTGLHPPNRCHPGNSSNHQNFLSAHQKVGKQNVHEMLSQTSKFTRGKIGSDGLQLSSMGTTDKLTDLAELLPNGLNQGHGQQVERVNNGFQSANQNSFKSQTLQFPSSFNSQLGDDFINLFANN